MHLLDKNAISLYLQASGEKSQDFVSVLLKRLKDIRMRLFKKIIHQIIDKFQMPNSTRSNESTEVDGSNEQRPKASSARLTAQDAMNAIYIDYEGNMKLPPTLLGWYVDGEYMASIIEPLFETCENRYKAKDIYVEDHTKLALRLIQQAEDEGRLIVSWSEHDYLLMSKVLKPKDFDRLKCVYRNAIRTARPWYRQKYGPLPEKASLDFFEDLVGFYVPDRFGLGLVGKALGLIRSQIQDGRSYGDLTNAAKDGWTTVVRHNKLDLQGMSHVLEAITAGKKS